MSTPVWTMTALPFASRTLSGPGESVTREVVGLDPLGDAEAQAEAGTKKNFAKVGSARPSSLLYTYGPGAIVDLPQFTVMPAGLDDWERIWARRDGIPRVHAPYASR